MGVCIYRKNLLLNDLQSLICHKTQATNQPFDVEVFLLIKSFAINDASSESYQCDFLNFFFLILQDSIPSYQVLWMIIYIYIYIYIYIKVNLATLVESDPKAPFSIATTPWCRRRRYSIPWIAPLYPWSLPYSAVLSKVAASTIFWVFGMTRRRIETRSPGPLANTLLIRSMESRATQKLSFQSLLYRGEGATTFPGLPLFTLDTYFMMVSVK